tara:strand:- start:189 stop:620 length:432 start_codon:yes stop_codon:yes gene_type:complete
MLDYEYQIVEYHIWIEKLVDHAKETYQAEVDLVSEDNAFIYEYKKKKVTVKGDTPVRDKLYILLHEVGHLSRMMENSSDPTYFMDRVGSANIRERVMTFMEEVLAWKKGEEIAMCLGIPIEDAAWRRLMDSSLRKYAEWIKGE